MPQRHLRRSLDSLKALRLGQNVCQDQGIESQPFVNLKTWSFNHIPLIYTKYVVNSLIGSLLIQIMVCL